MGKHGFIVAEDGDQLVLFQYLDPDDIAPVIDSDIYEDFCIEHGIYIHEAGRTADIDVMKRALYAMAYRIQRTIYTYFLFHYMQQQKRLTLKRQEERRISGQARN